jgi:hypothetical protein
MISIVDTVILSSFFQALLFGQNHSQPNPHDPEGHNEWMKSPFDNPVLAGPIDFGSWTIETILLLLS